MRGMVNLLILMLLVYHVRTVAQSLEEHDFVLTKELNNFWENGIMFDAHNYTTGAATLGLWFFLTFSFWLEKYLAGYFSEKIVRPLNNFFQILVLVITNISLLLMYPVVMIQVIQSSILAAVMLMIISVAFSLKLISFHHVVYDNR